MDRIDVLVRNAVDKKLNENKYKNGIRKVMAAANAANKADPHEVLNNWLAKQAALKDINKELTTMRSSHKKPNIDHDNLNLYGMGLSKDYINRLGKEREEDFDDCFNSENEFYAPIRDITTDFSWDLEENKKNIDMNKKQVSLKESDIKRIIRESISKVITEGSTSTEDCGKWQKLQEAVGAEKMVDELYNFLNEDQIKEFIEWMERMCDLYYDEEYEEYFQNQ